MEKTIYPYKDLKRYDIIEKDINETIIRRFSYSFMINSIERGEKIYRVNVTLVSVIEVGIQVFLRVKGFATQAAGPLRRSVLMFRLLLRSKNIPTFVERTLQRQFHLMFLQNWHPSLKPGINNTYFEIG